MITIYTKSSISTHAYSLIMHWFNNIQLLNRESNFTDPITGLTSEACFCY